MSADDRRVPPLHPSNPLGEERVRVLAASTASDGTVTLQAIINGYHYELRGHPLFIPLPLEAALPKPSEVVRALLEGYQQRLVIRTGGRHLIEIDIVARQADHICSCLLECDQDALLATEAWHQFSQQYFCGSEENVTLMQERKAFTTAWWQLTVLLNGHEVVLATNRT
jgi:hypothetical protein